MRFKTFETNDGRLHCAMAGDPSAPLIIALHGFPEYWAAWEGVMGHLASDFFVVAPDQRGYNLSSKPHGVDAYRARHMVADLAALADQLSPGRPFVLAGHDWGASVAYAYAFAHPQRLSHLVIVNGVHPVAFQRAILFDAEQRKASQYMTKLKAADAAQKLSADGFARLFRMLDGFSRTDWMTDDDRAAYRAVWQQPGALEAMLNWYRASPIVVPGVDEQPAGAPLLDMPAENFLVRMPHLVIWGVSDEALRPACLDALKGFAPQLTVRTIADAGHWVMHEKPEEVAAALAAFCSGQ